MFTCHLWYSQRLSSPSNCDYLWLTLAYFLAMELKVPPFWNCHVYAYFLYVFKILLILLCLLQLSQSLWHTGPPTALHLFNFLQQVLSPEIGWVWGTLFTDVTFMAEVLPESSVSYYMQHVVNRVFRIEKACCCMFRLNLLRRSSSSVCMQLWMWVSLHKYFLYVKTAGVCLCHSVMFACIW